MIDTAKFTFAITRAKLSLFYNCLHGDRIVDSFKLPAGVKFGDHGKMICAHVCLEKSTKTGKRWLL